MSKVVCVLYPDPVDGQPTIYPRPEIPTLEGYPGGQTLPTPHALDFTPGQLLGSVSGELGLGASWRARAIPSSSPPTRTAPTRPSNAS